MFDRKSKKKVSLYVVLGLTKQASDSQIIEAYERLVIVLRQDVADKKPGAKKRLKALEKAYCALGTPARRAAYDEFGTVGSCNILKQCLSPDCLERRGHCVKSLWRACFALTCCCCFYCCCHCCIDYRGNHLGEDDEDEIYIRETFSEYISEEPTSCLPCLARKERRRNMKRAARARRRDYYKKKDDGGKARGRGEGESKGEGEDNATAEKKNGGLYTKAQSKKQENRDVDWNRNTAKSETSLVRSDSGCDVGGVNGGDDDGVGGIQNPTFESDCDEVTSRNDGENDGELAREDDCAFDAESQSDAENQRHNDLASSGDEHRKNTHRQSCTSNRSRPSRTTSEYGGSVVTDFSQVDDLSEKASLSSRDDSDGLVNDEEQQSVSSLSTSASQPPSVDCSEHVTQEQTQI